MKEIKQTGNRYYVFSYHQVRSFPIKKAEAMRLIENGEAVLVESFITDPTPMPPAPDVSTESSNVVSLQDMRKAKEEKDQGLQAIRHFQSEILPHMTTEELLGLNQLAADPEAFTAEMMRITFRISLEGALKEGNESPNRP